MASTTQKKLRILCLHGHRHNPAVMDACMAPLRRALGDTAEFVHVRAMAPARGEPDALMRRHHMDKAPFFEWFDVRRLEEYEDQDAEWFFHYDGLDDALLYMDAQLQRLGAFDVALGFSQGAVLMTILAMYYTYKQQPVPWCVCVSVCGWRVRDYAWKFLFENDCGEPVRVPLPSIHVAGTKDPLHCETMELVDQFAGDADDATAAAATSVVEGRRAVMKRVLEFDGAHGFPSGEKHAALYRALVQSIYEMCGSRADAVAALSPKQQLETAPRSMQLARL